MDAMLHTTVANIIRFGTRTIGVINFKILINPNYYIYYNAVSNIKFKQKGVYQRDTLKTLLVLYKPMCML